MIISRSPLRISLGGGGTDLPSYYREHGGFLVSGAIDKYVYMLTHTVFQRRYLMKYAETEAVDDPAEIRHPILREALMRHWRGNPIEISSVANLHATKEMGYRSQDLLLAGDLESYAELMHEHWENKRRRSPGMATERVDTLYTLARRSGAIGGKLVGAGGGGFLLVYARHPS